MAPPSIEEPSLPNSTSSGFQNSKEDTGTMHDGQSGGWSESSVLVMELKNKILTFRDSIDLPSYTSSLIHLVVRTIVDLHKLYPNVIHFNQCSETNEDTLTQVLVHLYIALKFVGKLWGLNNSKEKKEESLQSIGSEQLGKILLAKLTSMTNIANRMFGEMDEDENNESKKERCTGGETLNVIYSSNKVTFPLPDASVLIPPEVNLPVKLEEFPKESCSQPCVLPLSIQAVGNLKADDMNCLTINILPHISVQNASFVKETKEAVDRLDAENQVGEESPMKISFEGMEDSKTMNDVQTIPKSNVMPEGRDSAASLPPPAPPTPPRVPPIMTLTVSSPSSVPLLNVAATPPPPPPSVPPSIGSTALPPPPRLPTNGALPVPLPPPRSMANGSVPPPPPPINQAKALRLKKTATKLKRSTQMANLYRLLKRKVEGSILKGKSPRWRKTNIGGAPGGKKGMADALTEMTKRSAYFQHIEEDVEKHAKLIRELKAAISSFQTKDMEELTKFHKYLEQSLEKLTDETQVLSRFEGFPVKKLESLRAAAALYLKLKIVLADLENWKVMPPLEQLLNEVEAYFNKIKGEMEALERSKDEEAKNFESNNIHFDFAILVRIKESLVDVSSSCMELALKEEREENAITITASGPKNEHRRKDHINMLWRSFQLAFRVYSFAGGQDDRADRLSKELADEIVTDSQ